MGEGLAAFAECIASAMGEGLAGDDMRAEHAPAIAAALAAATGAELPPVRIMRAQMLARWACTVAAPMTLGEAGMHEDAAQLRALHAAPLKDLADAVRSIAWQSSREHRAGSAVHNALWSARASAQSARRCLAGPAAVGHDAAIGAANMAAELGRRRPRPAAYWASAIGILREAAALGCES